MLRALLALVSVVLFCSQSILAQASDPASHSTLVESCLCAARRNYDLCKSVQYEMDVAVSRYDGIDIDVTASVQLVRGYDRCKISVRGGNIFGLFKYAKGEKARAVDLIQLHLPGGAIEQWDRGRDRFTIIPDGSRDPMRRTYAWGPNRVMWALPGGPMHEVFARYDVEVVRVLGSAPARVVSLVATSRPSQGVAIKFEVDCVERWHWLPRRIELFMQAGPERPVLWERHRTRLVHEVAHDRLCSSPVRWEVLHWDDVEGKRVVKDAPQRRYQVVALPASFQPAPLPDHLDPRFGSVSGDSLFDGRSFISSLELAARGRALDEVIQKTADVDGAAIRPPVAGWLEWVYPGLLALTGAICVGCLLMRRWRLAFMVLIAGGVLVAWRVRPLEPSDGNFDSFASGVRVTPRQNELRSRYLCGIDAVYSALKRLGREVTYEQVVRYVRPGIAGADMGQISVALECLGVTGTPYVCREVAIPAVPSVVHVFGDHYAVLSAFDGHGRVLLQDPAAGSIWVEWGDLVDYCSISLWVVP